MRFLSRQSWEREREHRGRRNGIGRRKERRKIEKQSRKLDSPANLGIHSPRDLPRAVAGSALPQKSREVAVEPWLKRLSFQEGSPQAGALFCTFIQNQIYISRYPSYCCLPCAYRICDLCFQKKSADVADKKKKKYKKETSPKKKKKETLSLSELATVKPLELTGYPGLLPSQREALVKSVLQKVQLGAVEEASLLVCKSSHLSTVGEVMESLVVCLMETDTKTRTAGGQLLDTLLIREAFEPDLVKKCVLEKLVETAVDMIEVVPNFWDSLAEIFSPSFNSAAFPLSVIKDSADLLPSDKMVCGFIFYTHFEIFTRLETFCRPS